MKRLTTLAAILSIALPLTTWSSPEAQSPEVSLEGLEQIEKKRRKEV